MLFSTHGGSFDPPESGCVLPSFCSILYEFCSICLSLSDSFWHSVFVLPIGPRHGQTASWSTISRWMCRRISLACGIKVRVPPIPVKAQSTRSVNASCDFQHQASVMFVRHPLLTQLLCSTVYTSVETSFGLKVLHVAFVAQPSFSVLWDIPSGDWIRTHLCPVMYNS